MSSKKKVVAKKRSRPVKAKPVVKENAVPTTWKMIIFLAGGEALEASYPTQIALDKMIQDISQAKDDGFLLISKQTSVRPSHVSAIRNLGQFITPNRQN